MAKALALATITLLQLICCGNCCPTRCQCFTVTKVFCSDDSLKALPQNITTEVEEMVVMTTSITQLGPDAFPEGAKLTKLVFLNNYLKDIDAGAFNHLGLLTELEISGHSQLTKLDHQTFTELHNLTSLLLNHNKLNHLEADLFASLGKLETLQLKGNELANLYMRPFRWLERLRLLDLSFNKISGLEENFFNGTTMLEVLRLKNNQITYLPVGIFRPVPRLQHLSLEGNSLKKLHTSLLEHLGELRELNLRENKLEEITPGSFPVGLRWLNLEQNQLAMLTPDIFTNLPDLTSLLLSRNKLSGIPEGLFHNLTSLEHLGLAENQLSFISKRIFPGKSKLKVIHLQKNKLLTLGVEPFQNESSVEELNLSDNLLKNLTVGLLDVLDLAKVVQLRGNPWVCDCGLLYLQDWLKANGPTVDKSPGIYCDGPAHLKGWALEALSREQLVCPKDSIGSEEQQSERCKLQDANGYISLKCVLVGCPQVELMTQLEGIGERQVRQYTQVLGGDIPCENTTVLLKIQ